MAKYNEIMARISVTPKMRQRVLANVKLQGKQKLQDISNKKPKLVQYRKWMPGVVAASLILAAGIHLYQIQKPLKDPEEPVVEGVYGLEEYDTIKELEEASGFLMPKLEDVPFEVQEILYSNVSGTAQIDYYGTKEERISILKAKDDGTDISGDYNVYESEKNLIIEDCNVTIKGNDGTFSLAIWARDGYAYATAVSPGMQEAKLQELIKQICTSEIRRGMGSFR